MKSFITDLVRAAGYNVGRGTADGDLWPFMKSLRPRDCGKRLIRVGGEGDGGYLVPDDLDGLKYCFSPGVSSVADFESHLADRGISSFLADFSVDGPPIKRPEFTFDKKFLGAGDDERTFTLSSWKNKYLRDYKEDLLLQMDIEGAEYEVILNVDDDLLDQFRIVVIEFHNLNRLFDPLVFWLFNSCFKKLCRHFHVVHLHPNNFARCVRKGQIEVPPVLEVTFYSKRRASALGTLHRFPHPLDRDSAPELEHISLPKCWYSD